MRRGVPRGVRARAGLRVFLLAALLTCCAAEHTPCVDFLLFNSRNSCTAAPNSTLYRDAIRQYVDCNQLDNATQGLELDLLVSAPVLLPTAVLARFKTETGWTVHVTPWDVTSSSGNAATSATSLGFDVTSDWQQQLVLSYDAWILDSELLGGLVQRGAVAPPAPLLDTAAFVEIQATAQPQVRRYGTSYRYLTAGIPLGSNTLVLYGNHKALWQLYGDERMRRRLGLQVGAPVGSGSNSSSSDGSSSSSSGNDSDSGDSSSSSSRLSEEDGSILPLLLPRVWTWEQLIDAAAAVNGTDFDGDGVVEYGICLEVAPGCLAPALLQGIAASYLQTHGASHGVLIDPSSMAWRLNSPGFRSAIWTLQRLLSYSAPLSQTSVTTSDGVDAAAAPSSSTSARSSTCRRLSAAFAEGRCAFAIHGLSHLKAAYVWPGGDKNVVYSTRIMMLPGSTQVDRGLYGIMEECTASSCPYASPLSDIKSAATYSSSWVSALTSALFRSGGGGAAAAGSVNVAPLVYANPVGGINAASPAASRAAAARLLSMLGSAPVQEILARDPTSGVTPFRRLDRMTTRTNESTAPLESTSPSSLQLLQQQQVSAVMVAPATQQDLDLADLTERLWDHPNAAPALRVPGAETLWPYFDAAIAELSPYNSPQLSLTPSTNLPYADDEPPETPAAAVTAALTLLSRKLPAALEAALPSPAQRRTEYRASLSYRQPVLTQRVVAQPSSSRLRVKLIVGLTLGLGGGAVLLAARVILQSRRTLRRLRGTSSGGDDSSNRRNTATYVVLDIQGLSEPSLPETVREQALRLCHDVVKQLARRYDGELVPLPHDEATPQLSASAAVRHGVGGDRLPESPAAALQAALAAAMRGSTADQAAAAVAAAAAAAGGPCSSAGYDLGPESCTGGRMRPPYWGYESSYLSLVSRDLDAPLLQQQNTDVVPVLDGPLGAVSGYGKATIAAATAATAAAAANFSSCMAQDGTPDGGAPLSPMPLPTCIVPTATATTTAAVTDSSGQTSPLVSCRTTGAAASQRHATWFHLFDPLMTRPGLNSRGSTEASMAAAAAAAAAQQLPLGSADANGAVPTDCTRSAGNGGGDGTSMDSSWKRAGGAGALSGRSLHIDVGGSLERTADGCMTSPGGAAAATTAAAAAVSPQNMVHYGSGGGEGGGDGSNGGGRGGGTGGAAPGANQLSMVQQTAPPPPSDGLQQQHRTWTSMHLQHSATANPALFLEQFKPATGKEHLSAGHLSDMLLPLPSSATITTKAAAGAAVAANAAAGGGPWATMSLNSEPHLPQSPFTVQYCTSSGEIPRPLQDSDGASLSGLPGQGLTLGGQVLGHQYLSGAWPSPSVLPTLPEGVTDSGMTTVDRAVVAAAAAVSGPRSGGGGAAATSGGVSDDLLAAMHAGRILPHAQSTPTTPLLGQLHALSPLRLRPMPYTTLAGASSQLSPAVPPAVAAAAAPSSQPLSSRGGGALAVAMAAARAAAGGASLASQRQLSTRLALIFASVHDAVCFCVHMQAMLTNCRWPSEVLELSSCQPIAVRPRAVSADVQQQACGAGGSPRADARKGGVDGVDGAAAAAGAMSTGVSGMAGCTDPGGDGVVMASTASSFITSATPSPFTPTGAVDRMKSLISGGAKGRSGRALRQGHLSPRLAVHGLGGGAAAAAAVPVATAAGLAAAPERSALSVSRFATASLGPGTSAGGCGTVARPFTSRSLMPYTSFGGSAHLGSDPWVVGGQISSAGCSRSGSTTVWRPPLLNGSFNSRGGSGGGRYTAAVPGGTAMMTSGLQYGGGGDFCPGSHIQPPRSALGRVSRSGGGGGGGGGGGVSPAYGSSLARVPHMGAVSQPLPKLNTVQFSPSFPEQASLCTATSTTAMRFPMPHGCGRTAAIQRSGCVVPDVATTAPPMATGGGARASSVLTSPPGIGGVSGIGGGTITAAAAAVAAGGGGGGAITGAAAALESGDSGLPGRIGGCSDRDTAMGIILGSLDYDTDGEAAGLQHVPSPPPYFTIASTAEGKDVDGGAAAMMTAYGGTGTTGDVSDRVVAAQVGSGGGGGDGGANCYPVQAASPAQLPGVTYDNVYDKAAGTSPTGGFQARRHSSYGDGSATSPAAPMPPMPQLFIIPAVRNMQQAMPTPEQVDAHAAMPPSWKSPPDTSSLRSAATPVTCEIGRTYPLYGAPATLKLNTDIDAPPLLSVPPFAAAATVVSDVNAGGGCDVGELSLSLAAGFRKVPTAEVLPLPPPPPAPPPAPSLAEMAEEMVVGSHGAWIHPPQPWYGRPVAECKEEISSSTNNLNPASTIGSALTATSLSGDCRTSRDVTRRAATAVLEAGDGSATGLGPSVGIGNDGGGSSRCGGGRGGSGGGRVAVSHPSSPLLREALSPPLPPSPPPPPPPQQQTPRMGDGMPFASVPLTKLQLENSEITPACSTGSPKSVRLRMLQRMVGAVQDTMYDTAPVVSGGGGGHGLRNPVYDGTNANSLGSGGGQPSHVVVAAVAPPPLPPAAPPPSRRSVRSFGEQVRLTFEELMGVERSNLEDGVTVIFRGPRVVCGISTWQYGDEECTDMYGRRRTAIDSGEEDLPLTGDDELAMLGRLGGGLTCRGEMMLTSATETAAAHARGVAERLESLAEVMALDVMDDPVAAADSSGGADADGDAAATAGAAASATTASAAVTFGVAASPDDAGDQHLYATQSNPLFYKTANGVLPALTPSYGGGTDITSDHVDDDVPNPEGAPATSVGGLGSGADDGGGGAPDDARVGVVRRRTTIMSPEARKYLRRRRMPAPLRRALAICESGQGGFVLLDGATYSASSQEALQEQCMILHMGEYVLAGVRRPLDLYLALDFAHLARVAYLRPLACAEQLSLGLPSAPVNTASICFSLVVGMQTLLAWNTEVAKAALAVLRDAVLPALLSHGGYLVEDADGLLLTAFSSSRSGLAWALECQEEAKHLDWPKELLGHDLGKELYMDDLDMEGKEEEEEDGDRESGNDILPVGLPPAPPVPHVNGGDGGDGSTAAAAAAAPYPRRHLVFRGLRIKSGLDCGDVLARVHATTGRMTYRGRVMNRAARIAGMATGGQVLCSRGLWDSSGLAAAPDLCQQALAVGASLGDVQLKGLSTKMEIISCIRILRSEVIPVAHEDVVLENSIGPIGTAPFQFHQKPGMQEQQHQQQEQDEDAEDNGADVDVEARDGADAIPPKPGMAPNCAVRTVPSGGGNYPGTATATAAPCPLDGGGSTPTGAYPGSLASAVPALSEYDSDGSGKECAGGSGGGSIRIGPGAAAGESSAAVVAAAAAVESATAGSVAPAAAVVTAAAESVPYVSKGEMLQPTVAIAAAAAINAAAAAPSMAAAEGMKGPVVSGTAAVTAAAVTAGTAAMKATTAAAAAAAAAKMTLERGSTGGIARLSQGASPPNVKEFSRYAGSSATATLLSPKGTTNASANMAAALAVARMRHASQLRLNRCVHGSGGGIRGGSGAVQAAVLAAQDEDDDMADRLVAGYSSDGSGVDSGDGGPGSGSDGGSAAEPDRVRVVVNGTSGGVAALHGMLRRQRPAGSTTTAGLSSAASGGAGQGNAAGAAVLSAAATAAAAGGGSGGTARGGHLAMAAAANFKKAFRVVKRSILEEPDGGGLASASTAGGYGSDRSSDGDGGTGAGVSGGVEATKLRRPPPRRASELVKSSAAAVTAAAGAGGARLFNRLRGLAVVRGGGGINLRGRGGGEALSRFDELEEDDESRFRPTSSATSAFFPSLSRPRLRDGSGGGLSYTTTERSSSCNPSPLHLVSVAGQASRTVAGGGGGGTGSGDATAAGGSGVFARASSRLGGNSLVAEMSLASMTMRRQMPVSRFLKSSASSGGGGGGGGGSGVGGMGTALPPTSPVTLLSTLPMTSSSASTPGEAAAAAQSMSPKQRGPPQLYGRPRSNSGEGARIFRVGGVGTGGEATTYGIQEADGEEEESELEGAEAAGTGDDTVKISTAGSFTAEAETEATAPGWASTLRRGSETRSFHVSPLRGGGGSASAIGTVPSLPFRLASFTSSFLQRAVSRKLSPTAAAASAAAVIAPGEDVVRPYSGSTVAGTVSPAGVALDGGAQRSVSFLRARGGGGSSIGDGKQGSGDGSVSPPPPPPLQPASAQLAVMDDSRNGGTAVHMPTAAAAAAAMSPPTQTTATHLSRVDSLRRNSSKESSATVHTAIHEVLQIRPSDGLYGHVFPSPTATTSAVSPSGTASLSGPPPPPSFQPVRLGRSATGLGFGAATEAAGKSVNGQEHRSTSAGQEGQGGVASPPVSAASRYGNPLTSALEATPPSPRCDGSTPPLEPHMSIYTGDGDGGGDSGISNYGVYGGSSARMHQQTVVNAGVVANPADTHAVGALVGGGGGVGSGGGSSWVGLFSSLHNFLGLASPHQAAAAATAVAATAATAGTLCPNSPKKTLPAASPAVLSSSGAATAAGAAAAVCAGRRRAVSHYLMDESVDGGGADGGGLGSPANAAAAAPPTGQRSQRRRSVIEVSGNVLFLNARSSYADSGWQLPAESETYGCGGSSTMLADQSCDGGAGDAVEPDAMYDVYEFADLLHHDVYSGQLAAAAKASPPSPPPPLSLAAAVPSAPRRRRSRRSTNLLAGVGSGSGGGNGGGGGETNLRTDVGSRPYSQFRQLSSSFKGGSHDVGGSNSQQRRSQPVMHSPRPLAHFAAVTAAAATAGDDSGIGNGNGSGSGAAFGQVQRSNTSAAHDLEPGGAVSGLGRLVRGLNGLIGRANSTTCNGGRRHLSGGSRQVFGSQRRGSVNAASGVMRSSGSATVDLYCDRGSSGDDRLERGTVVVAATAAAAAATDCGGGSASGEPTTATASGRRLVPELARSARELVSRVWSMRSTHSIGNESDGGGGGGGGSVSAGATSSSGGVRRDVAVSPELTAAATAAMPQLACGSLGELEPGGALVVQDASIGGQRQNNRQERHHQQHHHHHHHHHQQQQQQQRRRRGSVQAAVAEAYELAASVRAGGGSDSSDSGDGDDEDKDTCQYYSSRGGFGGGHAYH